MEYLYCKFEIAMGEWQQIDNFLSHFDNEKIDKISKRAEAYGMPGFTVDGNNVEEVYEISKDAILNAKMEKVLH